MTSLLTTDALTTTSWAIGNVLVISGVAKVGAKSSILGTTLVAQPTRHWKLGARWARGVGIVEVAIGVGLYGPFLLRLLALGAAAALFSVALGVLVVAKAQGSDRPCGCAGNFSTSKASTRSIARTAMFDFVAAATAVGWLAAGRAGSSRAAVWVALVLSLSVTILIFGRLPEGRRWAATRKVQRIRQTLETDCTHVKLGPKAAWRSLEHSRAWVTTNQHRASNRLDDADHWTEDCWDYFSLPATYDGKQALVTYGVHKLAPNQARAVLSDLTGRVLVEAAR